MIEKFRVSPQTLIDRIRAMDQNEQNQNPKVVVILSGKRKSGKDFMADILSKRLSNIVVIRLSAPIKKRFAELNELDFDRLLDSTQYKENHRQKMLLWSESIRKTDPNYFLRIAIEDANAKAFPVWLVSDARRTCDIQYFKSDMFRASKIITVRIQVNLNIRGKRGWSYTEGIDDMETECGLDLYDHWDFLITNDSTEEQLISNLEPLIKQVNDYCNAD